MKPPAPVTRTRFIPHTPIRPGLDESHSHVGLRLLPHLRSTTGLLVGRTPHTVPTAARTTDAAPHSSCGSFRHTRSPDCRPIDLFQATGALGKRELCFETAPPGFRRRRHQVVRF